MELLRVPKKTWMTRAAAFARWLPWPLLAAVVGRFLWESWAPHAQIDDAFISYRYAANLVGGHGLVFNPGERVEGFTNLLWTLLVAAGIGMGFEATRVAHVLGLASGVALLAATFDYTRLLLPRERAWAAAVPPALLGCTTAFGVWTTSGLETPLFAAFVTAGVAASARGRPGLATAFALLATATRPEGVVLAAAVYLPIYLPGLAARFREGWRAWRWPLVFAAGIALLTGFRLVYYGELLPNTFYAKVGGIPLSRGLLYTLAFLRRGSGWLLVPAGFALARDRRVAPGFLMVGLGTASVIAVGGDVFPDQRFFLPILPVLSALAVRGASRAWTRSPYLGLVLAICVGQAALVGEFGSPWVLGLGALAGMLLGAAALRLRRSWLLPVGAALGVLALAVSVPSARSRAIEKRVRGFQAGEDLARIRARILNDADPPVHLVAAMGIGAFGYFSNLPVLDLLGLVDPVIARSADDPEAGTWQLPGHARSNADYVLSRIPDVILMSPEHDQLPLPAARDLHEDPRFRLYYRWDGSIAGYRLLRHRRELRPRSDGARE